MPQMRVQGNREAEDFRQELSSAIRQLVTAEADKTLIDQLLLKAKAQEVELRNVHGRLLKRRSPRLKESDPVSIDADIRFSKPDYTDVYGISVFDRN